MLTVMTVNCFYLHCSEEAEALAKRLKLRFYRASVKEDLNVNEGGLLRIWSNASETVSFWIVTFLLFFF